MARLDVLIANHCGVILVSSRTTRLTMSLLVGRNHLTNTIDLWARLKDTCIV